MATQNFNYPSSSAVTIAAQGSNGAVAPTQTLQVGGPNNLGNLTPITLDALGNLNVNVTSSVAPAGSATAANQVLEIAQLTAINSNTTGLAQETTLSALNAKFSSLGQKTMANSAPVVIASDQSPISAVLQSEGLTNDPQPLYSILIGGHSPGGDLKALVTTNAGILQVNVNGGNVNTVDGSDGPVSPGAVATYSSLAGGQYNTPMPTLANNDQVALQVDINGKLITALPTNAAQETGGNLASILSATQNEQGSAAGGAAAAVSVLSGGIYRLAPPTLTNGQQIGLQVTTEGYLRTSIDGSSTTIDVNANQQGTWNINNISGAITLPTNAAKETGGNLAAINTTVSNIDTKLNTLGQKTMATSAPVVIASDQSAIAENLSQINGNTVLAGNGVTGTGSQRVTIASDNTPFTVNSQAKTPTAGTVTQAAITVGTSAVRLTVSGSAPSATRSVLVATPDSASTAKFYIGSSSVTNSGGTRGIQIVAGQTFIANSDAGDYYIISDTAAQTCYVMEQA